MHRSAAANLRWILIIAAIAIVMGISYGVFAFTRPTVIVTDVIEGPVVEAFYATGTLQAARDYPLKSNAAGIVRRIDARTPYIDKGDVLHEGQAVALVADPQLQFAYDKAVSELNEKRKRADTSESPVLREFDTRVQSSEELLEIARREQSRILKLLEGGGASQTDLDKALDRVKTVWGDLESAKAQKEQTKLLLKRELEVAEASLAAAKENLDLQVVRSPIDGVVLDRPVSLGTRVAINDHILLAADVRPEKLVMRAQVDEEYITKVSIGQTVQMVLYAYNSGPGKPEAAPTTRSGDASAARVLVDSPTVNENVDPRAFTAKVTKIYDKADPDRRTFEVDVSPVHPHPKFAAGMTGELAFEVRSKKKAVVVPSQAIQEGRIYVVRRGRLHAIEPQVGVAGVLRTEVVGGVNVGDRIVISPAKDLSDGKSVRERFLDPHAAADLNKPKEKELFRGGF